MALLIKEILSFKISKAEGTSLSKGRRQSINNTEVSLLLSTL